MNGTELNFMFIAFTILGVFSVISATRSVYSGKPDTTCLLEAIIGLLFLILARLWSM